MRSFLLVIAAAASVFTVSFAAPATASIDSVSGQVTFLATAPPSVQIGALQSDTTMYAFNEQQCVSLPSSLPVDITVPGTYDSTASLTPGSLAAGAVVSSQFVNADKIGKQKPFTDLTSTIHTDQPIIGIEVLTRELNGSDFLGAPGTLYPTGDFGRGLELDNPNQNDFVIEETDAHTVVIHSDVAVHTDQVRVITSCGATIVVKKSTIPAGDPATFSFGGDLSGTIGDGGTITRTVAPGQYSTTESVPAGWKLTQISCDDGGSSGDIATGTTTYHVAAGQTVTCTYTDTKLATLIVKKLTVPNTAPTTFPFTGDAAGTIGNGQSITVGNLLPGTYHSTEQVPFGWQLTALSCDDSDSTGDLGSATATFQLAAGETVTCTFTDTSTERIGGQGLTPGYWKQSQHFFAWAGYTQSASFDSVFGVTAFPSSATLLQVLGTGGGGVDALGRQAVAALLNATSPTINYPLYSWQVIKLVHDAIVSGNATTIEALKNQLSSYNSLSG
jgi:prealbumin domain-containing protein